MSNTSTETQDNPSPFMRPRVIIGATALGLVLLLAFIMSINFFFEDRRSYPHANVPACERPESSDTRYSGTLPAESWQYVEAAYTPVTPFGPSRLEEAPTCYEHSPAGAVTAAVHIATLGSTGQTMTVLDHMSVDSPNADAFREEIGSEEAVPANVPRPVGLRLNNYTGDTATASVVLSITGSLYVVDIDLLWNDGDWKWNPPSESLNVTHTSTLTGYNKIQEAPTNG